MKRWCVRQLKPRKSSHGYGPGGFLSCMATDWWWVPQISLVASQTWRFIQDSRSGGRNAWDQDLRAAMSDWNTDGNWQKYLVSIFNVLTDNFQMKDLIIRFGIVIHSKSTGLEIFRSSDTIVIGRYELPLYVHNWWLCLSFASHLQYLAQRYYHPTLTAWIPKEFMWLHTSRWDLMDLSKTTFSLTATTTLQWRLFTTITTMPQDMACWPTNRALFPNTIRYCSLSPFG